MPVIPPIPRPKDERFENMPLFLDDKHSIGCLTTTNFKEKTDLFD